MVLNKPSFPRRAACSHDVVGDVDLRPTLDLKIHKYDFLFKLNFLIKFTLSSTLSRVLANLTNSDYPSSFKVNFWGLYFLCVDFMCFPIYNRLWLA